MSIKHAWLLQKLDQWKNCVHLFHSLVHVQECFVGLDILVLRSLGVANLCLHVFNLRRKTVNVNLVPEGRSPSPELEVNQ